MTPAFTNSCIRPKFTFAKSRCASREASWARSCRVSSSTRISPSRTALPESKLIRATVPGRSALTVTPWTASMVPITDMLEAHCSRCATTLVTASGGGWNADACTAVSICRNFTKPRAPRSSATTTNMRINLFAIGSPNKRANSDSAPKTGDSVDAYRRDTYDNCLVSSPWCNLTTHEFISCGFHHQISSVDEKIQSFSKCDLPATQNWLPQPVTLIYMTNERWRN